MVGNLIFYLWKILPLTPDMNMYTSNEILK